MRKSLIILCLIGLLFSACRGNSKPLESFIGESVATVSNPDVSATEPKASETSLEDNSSTEAAQDVVRQDTPTPSPSDGGLTPQATTATQVSSNPYPVASGTSPATSTPPPSVTQPAGQTPQPPSTQTAITIEWTGEWNIWFQESTSKYIHSVMTLQQTGDKVTGSATIDGMDYTFDGTIFAQNEVGGQYTRTDRTVRFWWKASSGNTFLGSWAERFGFCGTKGEAIQPEPCRLVPPR